MSTEAWTLVAEGEEAAIFGYGVLTAELAGAERTRALSATDAHRVARDRARAALSAQDLNPEVPAAFEVPTLTNATGAMAVAAAIELRLTDLYVALSASTQDADRKYASQTAQETTARAVMWGWEPQAFPTALADQKAPVPATTTSQGSASSPNDGAKIE
ncbi:MAG: ferritin-like domain-containing protein [Actinomycetia bacterium]|nr:ferritin-like domain-containing protein [Actinomycetes bacterium]